MCASMNRSIVNVIFGGMGGAPAAPSSSADAAAPKGPVQTLSVREAAEALAAAREVLVVPGFGMAVAGASHSAASLAKLLASRGARVQWGVHPVAGRLPGQLNVLLAEAQVDYDDVKEMDEVNAGMEKYDACLVVGANDTVNAAAKEDPNSVIAGMPVIEVWRAKQVIFSKRSLAAGYAGADNLCFYKPNAALLLGDAKTSLEALRAEIERM